MPNGGQMFITTQDIFRRVPGAPGWADMQPFVSVCLRDTGCGMTEDSLARF